MFNSKIRKSVLFLAVLIAVTVNNVSMSQDFPKVQNKAFQVGEKLTFDVKFGFITAGVATMQIPKMAKLSGRDTYNILFEVNSVPSFDWFFKVRDRYESFLDIDGIFPWRFEQHIREGSFSKDYSAFFDHKQGKAKTTDGTYNIPKYTHDIISAFYYVRTLDFSKMWIGQSVRLQNFFDGKLNNLDVIFRGRERVTVAAGTFDCVIVEPLVQAGGLFKSEGSILVWLSDDDLKVPIKVKTKVVIGSIDGELTRYEGLKGNFRAKK